MFSNTLSFLSSGYVSDQASHPYKTTGKIIVLYILIFKFSDSNLEDKAAIYPHERYGTHFTGGWVSPKAGKDRQKISSPP